LKVQQHEEPVQLDPDDVEAIAVRVIELFDRSSKRRRAPRLATAGEVADALGVTRTWVYANQERLQAVRLGAGPKARLRFDLEKATRAFEVKGEPAQQPSRLRRSPTRVPAGVELIRGRGSRNAD